MSLTFSLVESASSELWDFGWFDISRFRVLGLTSEQRDPQTVLRQFLRDPIAGRTFCSTPDPWAGDLEWHGPFPIEQVAIDWYRPISSAQLQSSVASILDDPQFTSSPSAAQRQPIEAWLREMQTGGHELSVLEAPAFVRVRGDGAVWILFHEFVGFDAERGELVIAVIGYD